jgi:hypothetical protein
VWKLFWDNDAIELLIDYGVFREDGRAIVLQRLNAFLEHIGKPTVRSVEGYKII